jgi:hypothetical protein
MALSETFAFFNTDEFGTTCQIGSGSRSFVGILDSPVDADRRRYGSYVGSICFTAKTSDVSATVRGTAITVDGASYTVRQNLPIDDGLFSELLLSKV